MDKIAFFGTGLLGEPMARQLLEAGNDLIVFNRTKEKTNALKDMGATVVDHASEAIEQGDVFITMLTDYQAICDVLFFNPFQRFRNKTLIQMGTISPTQSLMVKERFESNGSSYLEAPVLGSIPQARTRTLLVLFGGTGKQYRKWLPLLKNFGEKVTHMGQVGQASAAKLALNQLIASLTASFSMSLGYLREQGANLDLFMTILRESALYAPTFDKKLERMKERNFENPNFPVKHLLKDVKLMLDEFSSKGIQAHPLKGVEDILDNAIKAGLDNLDYSALYNAVHLPQKKEKE